MARNRADDVKRFFQQNRHSRQRQRDDILPIAIQLLNLSLPEAKPKGHNPKILPFKARRTTDDQSRLAFASENRTRLSDDLVADANAYHRAINVAQQLLAVGKWPNHLNTYIVIHDAYDPSAKLRAGSAPPDAIVWAG